jgi:hypothetical protein
MTDSTRQSTLQCTGFRIGVGLFATLLCCGQSLAGEIDTQLWSEIKLTSHWTEQFDVVSAFATRFGEDVSHHDRTSVYLGLNVHLTPTLTLTPGYQYISTDLLDDVLSHEHRFNIIAALRLPIERFETTLSTGIEYRLRHQQEDSWRFRPRLKLKRPVGPDSWGLSAYVADEVFYDTGAADWTRNRLFVGFEKLMRRNWVLDFYYCRQRDMIAGEPDLNIIGFSMRFSLDKSASDSRVELPVE